MAQLGAKVRHNVNISCIQNGITFFTGNVLSLIVFLF